MNDEEYVKMTETDRNEIIDCLRKFQAITDHEVYRNKCQNGIELLDGTEQSRYRAVVEVDVPEGGMCRRCQFDIRDGLECSIFNPKEYYDKHPSCPKRGGKVVLMEAVE